LLGRGFIKWGMEGENFEMGSVKMGKLYLNRGVNGEI